MFSAAWVLSLWEIHTSLPSYTFPFLQVSNHIAASPRSSFWPPDASSPECWWCWWCWCLSTKNLVMCFMPQVSLLLWQCHVQSSHNRLLLYLESIGRGYVENMGNISFCSTFFEGLLPLSTVRNKTINWKPLLLPKMLLKYTIISHLPGTHPKVCNHLHKHHMNYF